MGLDMYLSANLFVSGYNFSPEKEKQQYQNILNAVNISPSHGSNCGAPSATLEITVAYWRKANHIHRWFVENVQGGEDNCDRYSVSRDQLKELLGLCEDVLSSVETVQGDVSTGTAYHGDGEVEHLTTPGRVVAQKTIAENKLPTAAGFFFGGTDYDEFYLRDTEETVKMLKTILADKSLKNCYFKYQASW